MKAVIDTQSLCDYLILEAPAVKLNDGAVPPRLFSILTTLIEIPGVLKLIGGFKQSCHVLTSLESVSNLILSE